MQDALKIAFIVPGSGNTFYCENCLRDCAAVKALRERGHDVVLVPMYLPLFADEEGLSGETPVFFGGINVYLQQKFSLFRKTPKWLDRLMDSRPLLGLAAERAGSTRAEGMGAMTLSMLNGMDGNQAKEVARLVDWLEQLSPRIVHFSNALLLGVVPELRRRLPRVRIVCSLQDEDTWLDALEPTYREHCYSRIAELAVQCNGLVAVSEHYAARMQSRIGIGRAALHIIPPGLDGAPYKPVNPATNPRRIGYLSRISELLGAGRLGEAFMQLAREPDMQDLELLYGGGSTGDDAEFMQRLQASFAEAGLNARVRFLRGLDLVERIELLSQLTVLCVPMSQGEAFGTFAVEALMMGVPVVLPDAGGFGEIVRETGGGVLYPADAADEPASTLGRLLRHPQRIRELGEKGRVKAIELYGAGREANELDQLYRSLSVDFE